MKDRELKHLSRGELLELLLLQTRETERLQEELRIREEELSNRILRMEQAGDLAHAVLMVNDVMEAAQQAARQYLDNIAAMEAETRETCQKLIAEAKEEAERIRRDAGVTDRKRNEALWREICRELYLEDYD